jgi:DNA modification methylase
VIAELAYTWFAPSGGTVLDPFAGGSVRGIVAALLGFDYHGIELRGEQVEANREQAAQICPDNPPTWAVGDALELLPTAPVCDFVFSCPPYHNLERYSDDARDLSAMDWPTFLEAYRRIIAASVAKLKPGKFACFVVGDFRDKATGALRGFPAETIAAFTSAGADLWNEIIYITPAGSLPVRVGAQFEKSRKIGRQHQSVFVFKKPESEVGR